MRATKDRTLSGNFLDSLYSFSSKASAGDGLGSIFTIIRKLRDHLHISQAQLAEQTGLPQSHIAKIESGKSDAQLKTIQRILDALNCDMLVLPKPRKRFDDALAQQARALAHWRVSRVMGTMALEKQRPDDKTYQRLLKLEEKKLLENPSEVWKHAHEIQES